jgi:hypothetical protein
VSNLDDQTIGAPGRPSDDLGLYLVRGSSDNGGVDTDGQADARRRIGAIFVEHGHITEEQLGLALQEQRATGQKLGEILVAKYGVSRLDLAGVLAERWKEDEAAAKDGSAPDPRVGPLGLAGARTPPSVGGLPSAMQAVEARLEGVTALGFTLKRTTDDLGERLAAVEALLAALTDALFELREQSAPPDRGSPQVKQPTSTVGTFATTGDLLHLLAQGPMRLAELRGAVPGLNEEVLHGAVAAGFVGVRATTLDGSAKKRDDEYFLTSAGASEIGEDPDGHPWPFRG